MSTITRFPHHPLLGRHQALDERSLAHTIERETTRPAIRPVDHPISIPILDQSDLDSQGIDVSQMFPGAAKATGLGSCTGNAGTYSLSTSPKLSEAVRAAGGTLDERYAIHLYADATHVDQDLGEAFPPTDCGSSGLGICRTLKKRGLAGSYTWATSLEGLAALLQRGSVMIGTPWFNSWFEPDPNGFVDAGGPDAWEASGLAGGHEICGVALESWDERRPERSVIRFPNSWAESWGVKGYGRMRLSTYVALRRQIDVKQIRA